MRTAAVFFAGVVYLALVLFDNIQSPLFALVLIVLAAAELRRPHRTRQ